jgi:hypothetical protein
MDTGGPKGLHDHRSERRRGFLPSRVTLVGGQGEKVKDRLSVGRKVPSSCGSLDENCVVGFGRRPVSRPEGQGGDCRVQTDGRAMELGLGLLQ